MRIQGETGGVKNSLLQALENLYNLTIPKDSLWTAELINEISAISSLINREIALYLNRKGQIVNISIGKHNTVNLPEVDGKRNTSKLSGIRCIHTHPNGSGLLSPADTSSLKMLRLDAMISIGISNGLPLEIFVGILQSVNSEEIGIYGPYNSHTQNFNDLLEHIAQTEKQSRQSAEEMAINIEKAILVGLQTRESQKINGVNEAEVSLAELEELAKTAGAIVAGKILQKRDTKSSSTIVGQGKIEEIKIMAQTTGADIIIFDEELTGTQQRNIEEAIGAKVLSRTSLILDIFAQRARSREGKLQVELAQLEYRLPRLTGMGLVLSRLGGGIGTRGPGETKLENDRRAIRTRIAHLKEQLSEVRKQRGVLRSDRKKSGVPVVSLVGYTNAGKSTLLNTLCNTDVLAEDKLFATLDTTTRKLLLGDNSFVLLTDTVGFIRRLPHNLLNAFKSTLEEVVLSDLILIVADASDPYAEDHIRIVNEILNELGASNKPTIIVLNKIDRLTSHNSPTLLEPAIQAIEVSAKTGEGLDLLKQTIKNTLYSERISLTLSIPFSDGATLALLHSNGKILGTNYDETNALVTVELDKRLISKVSQYVI